ncbi:MAG TPA: sulfite exporter TauE/SafE family protein [bacterium]|nr:sulfite exporter TauE/SafE family protein [bacterium]
MTTTQTLLLLVAGAVAGTIGAAGGIASLVSYPALLAVGIPALPANVTNAVALVTFWPGSALGSQPELRGQGAWVRRWAPVAIGGSALGTALLLLTPSTIFTQIVPLLVAFASVVLLVQPWISVRPEHRSSQGAALLLPCGLFAVSVYNSYWGAGSGVMTLTLLLLTVNQHLATSNALKNMLLGIAQAVCVIGFVLFGPVHWGAAVPLAVGTLAGSMIGPSVTRRLPAPLLRVLVALSGFWLAAHLWATRG